MAKRNSSAEASHLLSGDVRDDFREKQIDAIKAEVRAEFAEGIHAAANRKDKKAVKALRDAEIERRTAVLIKERQDDGAECL